MYLSGLQRESERARELYIGCSGGRPCTIMCGGTRLGGCKAVVGRWGWLVGWLARKANESR